MELSSIPKKTFTSCFQDLQKIWQQCIDCGGDYFEALVNKLNVVFFTDSVSEIYGQRLYNKIYSGPILLGNFIQRLRKPTKY
jgi:hypothetical protein